MTSKIFSNRITPMINMFRFSLYKNLGLIILFAVVCLMFVPGTLFVFLRSARESGLYENYYEFKSTLIAFGVIGGAGAVLFNFVNFTFLYSKKAGDLYHAFPLTRTGLLLSKTFSGFVSVALPLMLSYISLFIFDGYMKAKYDIFIDTKIIWLSVLFTFMTVLVSSAVSLFFVISAGNTFDFFVSIAAINGGVLLVGAIINALCSEYLFGFYGGSTEIFCNISPIFYIAITFVEMLNLKEITSSYITAYLLRTVICTLVFTAVNIFLFNKRKSEKAEQAYAFNFIYVICAIIISFCAGFGVGVIFSGGEFDIIFWVFTVISALFFAVAFGAVSDRGFKTFKKSLINGAVAIGLLISVFIITKGGAFGFTNRIPKAEDVSSVEVNSYFLDGSGDIEYENPEFALNFHKKLVENGKPDTHAQTSRIDFIYHLEKGKTIKRSFTVKVDENTEELLSMLKSEERMESLSEFFYGGTAENGYIHIENGTCNITRKEAQKIFELYKKELPKMTKATVLERYNENKLKNIYFDFPERKYTNTWCDLYIEPTFTETLEYIKTFEERVEIEETEKY